MFPWEALWINQYGVPEGLSFKDTIYNNIIIGRPDATREEVIEAAKKARCYDLIMSFPEGFDTVIGEAEHRFPAEKSKDFPLLDVS